MHQASLIGEYVHDSTDYGWSQLEQGLNFLKFKFLMVFCLKLGNIIGRK
jgi:hypothetical protein